MMNTKRANLDQYEMLNRSFSQENDAQRVVLVGGENISVHIDSDKIAEALKNGLNTPIENKTELEPIYIPQIITKNEIQVIEKQVFIPQIEYKTIEIPVITERVVTIEKPIYITEYKTLEIPKIIKEYEFIKQDVYPQFLKVCAVAQAVGIIGILLLFLLKK